MQNGDDEHERDEQKRIYGNRADAYSRQMVIGNYDQTGREAKQDQCKFQTKTD